MTEKCNLSRLTPSSTCLGKLLAFASPRLRVESALAGTKRAERLELAAGTVGISCIVQMTVSS